MGIIGDFFNSISELSPKAKLVEAASHGDNDTVKKLLNEGVDINATSSEHDNCTALICAAINGHAHTVTLLLHRSAHVNKRDADGYTALMCAVLSGSISSIKALIKKGTLKGEYGKRAWFMAVEQAINSDSSDHLQIMKTFLDLGVDIDAMDFYSEDVHYSKGDKIALGMLGKEALELGLLDDKETALAKALSKEKNMWGPDRETIRGQRILKNCANVIKFLLENGADIYKLKNLSKIENEIILNEIKKRELKAKEEREQRERQEREILIDRGIVDIDVITGKEFETLILEVFKKLGYIVETTPVTGDWGIDGFLYKDNYKMAIQCKRQKSSVGQPALRDFLGSLAVLECNKGLFITTSYFTDQAFEFTEKTQGKIELYDRKKTLELMRSVLT